MTKREWEELLFDKERFHQYREAHPDENPNLAGMIIRTHILGGFDLHNADLRNAYLNGGELCGANLRGADLRGFNLRGVDCTSVDFRGAKFSEDTILAGVKLYHTRGLPRSVFARYIKELESTIEFS